ncbi:hypothetical protein B296_00035655, partial [Ensete ventricosum]
MRLIEGEIDRRRSIEGEKGKKKKRKRRGEKKEVPPFPAFSSPAPSPPAGRLRVFAALARWRFFSHARRRNVSPVSPRREIDRGD